MSKALFNLDYECNLIAIVLQHYESYAEIGHIITHKDFTKSNSLVWQVIQNTIENKEIPTTVVLAERLKSLGIDINGLPPYEYLEALRFRPIDKKGILSISKEIKKLSLVRRVIENADKLKEEVLDNTDAAAKNIIELTDKYLGNSLISLSGEDREAKNLLELIPDIIEEMGNAPDESPYIKMPYDTWNDVFGPLRPGQIYAAVARQGGNKSTFLLDVMRELPAANPDKENLSILYLDSEMRLEDTAVRYIAGKIGCPYWLIDSHQWRKDSHWCPLIRQELKAMTENKHKNLWFEAIGNMSGQEMDKFVRRWYLNKCGKGNPCVIMYDYLKINSNDKADTNSNKEYEIAYDKTEILKDLAEYTNAPLFTAVQGNRGADIAGKNGPDDSSGATSISDRIGWLVALMFILRRRTPEEVIADSFGEKMIASTHKLIDLKQRYLGKEGPDYLGYVKVQEGKDIKYKKNFINFDINNFRVKDCGTYSKWLEMMGKTKIKLDKPGFNSGLL